MRLNQTPRPLKVVILFALVALSMTGFWYFVFQKNVADADRLTSASFSGSGSQSGALDEEVIDFSACAKSAKRFDGGMSTTYVEVFGIYDDSCVIKYGHYGDLELPVNGKEFTQICYAPRDVGKEPEFTGVTLTPIAEYCTDL